MTPAFPVINVSRCLLCPQSDVIHQSVFELVHTDDRDIFRQQLHFALNPPAESDGEGTRRKKIRRLACSDPSPPLWVRWDFPCC